MKFYTSFFYVKIILGDSMIELINNKIFLGDNYEIREYYTEDGNVKGLIYDGCIQSLIYIDKDKREKLVSSYFENYDLPLKLNPNGKNYLMLGGGAICYPHHCLNKYNDKKIDIVEIDNKCIEYSKEHFYLNELLDKHFGKINIIVDDAINYISYVDKKYDYILIDLFDGKKPIKEIYEDRNILNIKKILNEAGIVIVNYIITNTEDRNFIDIIVKMFNNYKIIIDKKYYNVNTNNGNVIIIMSDKMIDLTNVLDCAENNNVVVLN